jgi:hypothetical protein
LPAFLIGLIAAVFVLVNSGIAENPELQVVLVVLWSWLYGCAVHAAGFFMPRGVRWLGWIFILAGSVLLASLGMMENRLASVPPHLVMGGIFGGLHLIYGIYLHFTEQKNPVA